MDVVLVANAVVEMVVGVVVVVVWVLDAAVFVVVVDLKSV